MLAAALVNRFAKEKRGRIKRVVILYVLYLACLGATRALEALRVDAGRRTKRAKRPSSRSEGRTPARVTATKERTKRAKRPSSRSEGRVGDWIQLENGKQGLVKEIRWRHTVVEARDWDTVIVPYAQLLANEITMLGKRIGQPLQHRVTLAFQVDYRYPASLVIEGLQSAPIPGVAATPPAFCFAWHVAKDGRDSFGYDRIVRRIRDFFALGGPLE